MVSHYWIFLNLWSRRETKNLNNLSDTPIHIPLILKTHILSSNVEIGVRQSRSPSSSYTIAPPFEILLRKVILEDCALICAFQKIQ